MTPEAIGSIPPQVLSEEQRAFFFEHGYLCLEGLVPEELVGRLQAALGELIDRARPLTESDENYVLQSGHSADAPRLRRVYNVSDHHATFWEFASQSIVLEMVADLVGPDVKFREAYINLKWAGGGDAVEWHQDMPFFPHTNRAVVTTLMYLEDVTPDMGPFMVIPGSHRGELFDHYGADGTWAGRVSDADLGRVDLDTAVSFTGPAGTVVAIDPVMIHGSERNDSARSRPLLITGYAAADSFAYTSMPAAITSKYATQIVRGKPATHAHHDPMRLRMPPDWSGRYTSIFEDQQREKRVIPQEG